MRVNPLITFIAALVGTYVGYELQKSKSEVQRAVNKKRSLDHPIYHEEDMISYRPNSGISGEKKDFAGRGKKYVADFGNDAYEMFYHLSNRLTFRELHGTSKPETVDVEIETLRDNLYVINWKQKNGDQVTQIIDFDYQTISLSSLSRDKKVVKLIGNLRLIS